MSNQQRIESLKLKINPVKKDFYDEQFYSLDVYEEFLNLYIILEAIQATYFKDIEILFSTDTTNKLYLKCFDTVFTFDNQYPYSCFVNGFEIDAMELTIYTVLNHIQSTIAFT